jgi:hypothetical protein
MGALILNTKENYLKHCSMRTEHMMYPEGTQESKIDGYHVPVTVRL